MLVAGPHFIEYLSYEVTQECCVILKCKVRQKRDCFFSCTRSFNGGFSQRLPSVARLET